LIGKKGANMAVLQIPEQNRTITGKSAVGDYLAEIDIEYDVWEPSQPLPADASQEDILRAYSAEIEKLKARGGYVTADVINVNPQTPGLDAMLAKFSREHWHDEDEVRFVVQGRGIFHVNPRTSPVVGIEVEPGDLIRVPRGTLHWFDLCTDKQIRCIRLFQDPTGWTPLYTDSGVDAKFEPVCMGRSFSD